MGSDRVTVPHLEENGSNLISWKSDILDLAAEKHEDIPKYITGDLDAATDTSGHDATGMRIMRLRMGPMNKSIVRSTKTAYQMMRVLEDTYRPTGIISQVALRQQLSDHRADEGTDLEKHCAVALDLRSKLADADAPIADEQFCKTLLMSLPQSYHPFASTFKSEQFSPSIEKTVQHVPHTVTLQGFTGTASAAPQTTAATTTGAAAATATTAAAAGPNSFTIQVAQVVERKAPPQISPNSLVRLITAQCKKIVACGARHLLHYLWSAHS